MGFSNGNLTSKAVKVEKGERGKTGEGSSLTADNHYHIRDKRLTNVSPPVEDHDATTKKYITDLLKVKAGTTYVNNEPAKKANKSTLGDYVLKTDLPSDVTDLNALTTNVNNRLANYYTKGQIDGNLTTAISAIKLKISIQAEENGSITNNAYEWSFGDGGKNNPRYGWPCPSNGRILCGAISTTAGNNTPGEIKVAVVVNGAETGSVYIITKRNNQFPSHFTFSIPRITGRRSCQFL